MCSSCFYKKGRPPTHAAQDLAPQQPQREAARPRRRRTAPPSPAHGPDPRQQKPGRRDLLDLQSSDRPDRCKPHGRRPAAGRWRPRITGQVDTVTRGDRCRRCRRTALADAEAEHREQGGKPRRCRRPPAAASGRRRRVPGTWAGGSRVAVGAVGAAERDPGGGQPRGETDARRGPPPWRRGPGPAVGWRRGSSRSCAIRYSAGGNSTSAPNAARVSGRDGPATARPEDSGLPSSSPADAPPTR